MKFRFGQKPGNGLRVLVVVCSLLYLLSFLWSAHSVIGKSALALLEDSPVAKSKQAFFGTNSFHVPSTEKSKSSAPLTAAELAKAFLSMMDKSANTTKQSPPDSLRNINKKQERLANHWNVTFKQVMTDPLEIHRYNLPFYVQELASVPMSNDDLWNAPDSRIPEWMRLYMSWHKHKHKQLVEQGIAAFPKEKFLVLQCLHYERKCGGVSDRLKPIPWFLQVAYKTRRLLYIHWTRPAHLEEFLVPPPGGFQWSAPDWLKDEIDKQAHGPWVMGDSDIDLFTSSSVSTVYMRFQHYQGGMHQYNNLLLPPSQALLDQEEKVRQEAIAAGLGYKERPPHLPLTHEINFNDVFHSVWRTFFTPSPPIRTILENDMKQLGLVPGRYTGAHLRVLYAMNTRDEDVKRNWAVNAVNCATELRPATPIYFASDSTNATFYARQYAKDRQIIVNSRTSTKNPPLHIDDGEGWKERHVSDYYDAFVDLYVMAQSHCLTYNKGGFGVMALLMSRNATCGFRQDALNNPTINKPCSFVPRQGDPSVETEHTRIHHPLPGFVPSTDPIYVTG